MGQEVFTNTSQVLHGLHKGFLGVVGNTLLSDFSVPRRSSLEDLVIFGQVGGNVVLNVPVWIIQSRFLML